MLYINSDTCTHTRAGDPNKIIEKLKPSIEFGYGFSLPCTKLRLDIKILSEEIRGTVFLETLSKYASDGFHTRTQKLQATAVQARRDVDYLDKHLSGKVFVSQINLWGDALPEGVEIGKPLDISTIELISQTFSEHISPYEVATLLGMKLSNLISLIKSNHYLATDEAVVNGLKSSNLF